MSSRNVAVRKDVYDALAREKRAGESFTQVMVRLLHQRGPLEEVRGSWRSAGKFEEAELHRLRFGGGARRESRA